MRLAIGVPSNSTTPAMPYQNKYKYVHARMCVSKYAINLKYKNSNFFDVMWKNSIKILKRDLVGVVLT